MRHRAFAPPARLLALLLLAACAPSGGEAPLRPAEPKVTDQVRRLAAILDYIAADYPGCVEGTEITNELEYDEQLAFLDDAAGLAEGLPAPPRGELDLDGRLASLRRDVQEIAPPEAVSEAARSLGRELTGAYGVVIAPAAAPSLERGRALFRENCVRCHGERGAGDGPRTREEPPLAVPPRSFLDPEIMADMSPVRAYNALTDGIEEAEMPKWDLLSPSDRWSLAFHVFTLRHSEEEASEGRGAYEKVRGEVPAGPARLARASDAELLGRLEGAGLEGAEAGGALAYLRRLAPYESSGAPLEPAREHLAAALIAYREGERGKARREALAAYLDGFEPHEAALGAHDKALIIDIERGFHRVRHAIGAGEHADSVEQQVLHLGTLLDRAEDVLRGEDGASVAFVSSMIILLREGLEAALLILLLYGIARRAGSDERDLRAVHAGWIGALGLGLVTWFAAGSLIGAIGGARRELIEGVVALLASAVLLGVSHYVLARLDAQRRVAALKERLAQAASSPKRRLFLAGLGFIAVYREAFETVLFLKAIMLDAASSGAAVAGGALAGTGILAAVVFAMTRLGKKLKPAPILTALGTLLCALAVVLAGKGVRALQEAAVVPITPLGELRIDLLGVYPTTQTMLAQFAVAAAFGLIASLALIRSRPAGAARAASA